jgi:hypothetical protein
MGGGMMHGGVGGGFRRGFSGFRGVAVGDFTDRSSSIVFPDRSSFTERSFFTDRSFSIAPSYLRLSLAHHAGGGFGVPGVIIESGCAVELTERDDSAPPHGASALRRSTPR